MIRKPPEKLTLAEWNRVLGVNLTGAFLFAKHAAPHFGRRRRHREHRLDARPDVGGGDGSILGVEGRILALTHSLAVSTRAGSPGELRHLRAGLTRPGEAAGEGKANFRRRHRQYPGRVGQPGNIARRSRVPAFSRAVHFTGANITADGGMTRKMIYVE